MRKWGWLSIAVAFLSTTAVAQEFPTRPINLIVPWPAGGGTDILLRALAEEAGKHLGQPLIIENKAGGSGTVGPATMAATAKPDGYTIAQLPVTVHRLPLMQKTSWKSDDFTYIIHLTGYVFVIYANAATPFYKWQDVVEFAKTSPGKVTYGTTGAGSSPHLGVEAIADAAGIKLTHVPFKGASENNAAVVGGHIMLSVGAGSAKALVDAGKLRFMNVWTNERLASLPDVPNLKELGYPLVIDSPFGIAGPKGMDPKVVAKLHDAFKLAMDAPTVRQVMDRYDMLPNYKGSDAYRKAVQELIVDETRLIEKIGLARNE